jgi:hypothetical protein
VSVVGGSTNDTRVSVSLLDRDGNHVIRDVEKFKENLEVPQAKLWWPYLMDPDPAYLYILEVRKTTSRIWQAFRGTALPLCAVRFKIVRITSFMLLLLPPNKAFVLLQKSLAINYMEADLLQLGILP